MNLPLNILVSLGVLLGLYLSSLYSYNLFHSLAEIFSISVGVGIFIVTWNSRRVLQNGYLMFLGLAFFFTAILDTFHTLAYKGMGVFIGFDANLPTQLWIAARYLQSISLLVAPIFLRFTPNMTIAMMSYIAIVAFIFLSIFLWGIFPTCYVEGAGLTTFKVVSEYVICVILVMSLYLLVRNRERFNSEIFNWLALSIGFTIVSELAFTSYVNVHDFFNLIGHFFKIGAFYFVYKAILETGIRQPYEMIFRELSEERERLRQEIMWREKLQEEADRNLEKYHIVADFTHDWENWLDPGGNFVYSSPSCERITGYKAEDFISNPDLMLEIVFPDDQSHFLRDFYVHDTPDKTFDCHDLDFRIVTKNGQVRWLSHVCQAVFGRNGEYLGRRGSNRDITGRKTAENELKASEARFRSYFELPLTGIAITSLDKGWLEVNSTVCDMLGYSREELSHMTWDELTHPDDREADISQFERVLAGEIDTYFMEKRFIRKDGNEIWTNLSVGCVRKSDGSVDYTVAMLQNISSRKEAEKFLQDHLRFLQTLVEAIPNPIWFKGIDGKYIGCNRGYETFFGCSRENIVGRTSRDVFAPEAADKYFQADQELFNSLGSVVYEDMIRHSDGTTRPVVVSKATFTNSEGQVAGLIGVIQDITERVSAEKEKEKLQDELFQSQKLASLRTLVGGLAHDFNNMLQVITGHCQMLMDDANPGGLEYFSLKNIFDTSMQAANLITKLLAFGQQSQVLPKPIDLNDEIRNSHAIILRTVPSNVQVEIKLIDESAIIEADVNQIAEVLINLVDNATEAMQGGGKLDISTRKVTIDSEGCKSYLNCSPGDYVVITVSDTGCGMDEVTLAKIFDPFFSTKPRGAAKGMGLGLAVVNGIVQQSGGFISCSSRLGHGTELQIHFPEIEKPPIHEKPVSLMGVNTGTETILVVEDVSTVADLEKAFLEQAGYRVLLASNGLEAVNLYNERKDEIALVLLDLMMPVMSGRECLMELLKINPSVRTLIFSGYSPEDQLSKEVAPFVKGFVRKPCRKNELLVALRRAIDG